MVTKSEPRRVKGPVVRVLTGGLLILVCAQLVNAQSPPQPSTDQVLVSLLAEVRALRATIEQLAAAGPRIQLSVARLQIEEQRLSTLNRELREVQERQAAAQRQLSELTEALSRIGEEAHPATREHDAERRTALKSEATRTQRLVTSLMSQEADLTQQISIERTDLSRVL